MKDRAEIVHENFLTRVAAGDLPASTTEISLADSGLDGPALVTLFESQVLSRHLDLRSRKLQAAGEGFYTIGSSGHEGNAAVAAACRPDDMAFLHYRDAAFLIQRATQVPGQTPLWDMLLSFVASSEDPISGGRHKVLGSVPLAVPPQTSTIASHLPKAVGAAYAAGLARQLHHDGPMPRDAVVVCSFGDASVNHSTAQGAINTACWTAYQGVPLPLVLVCEDNGIGISTQDAGRLDRGRRWRQRPAPQIHTATLDGLDMVANLSAWLRRRRILPRPGATASRYFLHMATRTPVMVMPAPTCRTAYMAKEKRSRRDEANDPLLHSARMSRSRMAVLDRGRQCPGASTTRPKIVVSPRSANR